MTAYQRHNVTPSTQRQQQPHWTVPSNRRVFLKDSLSCRSFRSDKIIQKMLQHRRNDFDDFFSATSRLTRLASDLVSTWGSIPGARTAGA